MHIFIDRKTCMKLPVSNVSSMGVFSNLAINLFAFSLVTIVLSKNHSKQDQERMKFLIQQQSWRSESKVETLPIFKTDFLGSLFSITGVPFAESRWSEMIFNPFDDHDNVTVTSLECDPFRQKFPTELFGASGAWIPTEGT